jgi:hypothetical protein
MVLHETGHAYDYITGSSAFFGLIHLSDASSSAAFRSAYNGGVGFAGGYYTPTGNPGAYLRETYAESFARFYSGAPIGSGLNSYWTGEP